MLELIAAAPEPKSPPPRRKRDRRRTLTKVDLRSRLGKRISELTILFSAALGVDSSPFRQLKIERAAQLSALAELARGDHMRGKPTGDIVRLERAAAAAVRSLGELEPKPRPPTLTEILAQPRSPQ